MRKRSRRGGPVLVPRSRRRAARLLACLVATVVMVLGGTGQAAANHFHASTSNDTNSLRADVLAPPTAVSVSQACVTDPMPVRRSPGGSSFDSATGSGTLTIARPAGAQVGDVIVASVTWNSQTGITDASGLWTPVYNPQLAGNGIAQSVYYRVVTATEPTSYTWNGGSDAAAGGIVAYSGVDRVTPVNASSGQTALGGSSMTAPSLTTNRAGARLVGLWGVVGVRSLTAPTGMTSIWNGPSNGTGGGPAQVTIIAADEPWASPGATGTRTPTSANGTSSSVAQLVALQPPARPHATTTWTRSSSAYATGQVYRRSSAGTAQRTETLSATAISQTDGPLVSGTGYTVDVAATFAGWTSTRAARSFTAISC